MASSIDDLLERLQLRIEAIDQLLVTSDDDAQVIHLATRRTAIVDAMAILREIAT